MAGGSPGLLAFSPGGPLAYHRVTNQLVTVGTPVEEPDIPEPSVGSRWTWSLSFDIYVRNVPFQEYQKTVGGQDYYKMSLQDVHSSFPGTFKRINHRADVFLDIPGPGGPGEDHFDVRMDTIPPPSNQEGVFLFEVNGISWGSYPTVLFNIANASASTVGKEFVVLPIGGSVVGTYTATTCYGWAMLYRSRYNG